ncbi:unnamed protein product [Schistocephalus solidus]|uniref:C2H2-type domain-containing protein n=1 Tax=Schistocephalus solidus TaxID=70667 RepID=A0A3P7BIC3_SCHSO|nr:unnamed protein product [Schistocephalus solidus]
MGGPCPGPIGLEKIRKGWCNRLHANRLDTNRFTAAKAKRATHNSQAPRINTANAQALPTCPRCQRTFHARIHLVGYLRIKCNQNPTTSTSATSASDLTTTTIATTNNHSLDAPSPTIPDTFPPPPLPPTTATNTTYLNPATIVATYDYLQPATSTTTTITTTAPSTTDGDSVITCPHCDRTFTSHIGLVSHLCIHRTETGDSVSGAPTHQTGQRPPTPMPTLSPRIRSPHGPDRSHAHPRKRNSPRGQHIEHILRIHQNFQQSSHECN